MGSIKGRPKAISDRAQEIISRYALNSDMQRTSLARILRKEIRGWGERSPRIETLEKMISKVRKHPISPLDEPWSLASLANPAYNIPPEALPVVLKVWKMSLLMEFGQPLTIRQAKWVTHLRACFPERDIGGLYRYASEYALREQVCEILRNVGDTSDLDYQLAMSEWELTVADVNGMLPKRPPALLGKAREARKNAALALEVIAGGTVGEALQWELTRGSGSPKHPPIILSEEEEWVYAIWLRYLGKGPSWWSLSDTEQRKIMVQLQEWVKKDMQSSDKSRYPFFWSKPEHILDAGLVQRVGYDIYDGLSWEEKQHYEELLPHLTKRPKWQELSTGKQSYLMYRLREHIKKVFRETDSVKIQEITTEFNKEIDEEVGSEA